MKLHGIVMIGMLSCVVPTVWGEELGLGGDAGGMGGVTTGVSYAGTTGGNAASPGSPGSTLGDFRQVQPAYMTEADAMTFAAAHGVGQLMILERGTTPVGVWDFQLATLSTQMPFIRKQSDDAVAYARLWGIGHLPAVASLDEFGNVLDCLDTHVTAGSIAQLIRKLPEARRMTAAGLGQHLRSARTLYAAGKIGAALMEITRITRFKGYPEVMDAEDLHRTILEDGFARIRAVTDTTDPKTAREQLGNIRRTWADTTVATQATEALKALP